MPLSGWGWSRNKPKAGAGGPAQPAETGGQRPRSSSRPQRAVPAAHTAAGRRTGSAERRAAASSAASSAGGGRPASPDKFAPEDVERKVEQVRDDFLAPLREMISNVPSMDMSPTVVMFLDEACKGIQQLQGQAEVVMSSEKYELIEAISAVREEFEDLSVQVEEWQRHAHDGTVPASMVPLEQPAAEVAGAEHLWTEQESEEESSPSEDSAATSRNLYAQEVEAQRQADEDEEEEGRRRAAEVAAEEEARQHAAEQEEERIEARRADSQRLEEESRQRAEEQRRAEEEADSQRRAEFKRQAEEQAAKRRAEEAAARRVEEEEEEARQEAEEARRQEEEREAKKRAELEEIRQRHEAEARRLAQEEDEARIRAEAEDRERAAEEAKRAAQQLREEEAKRLEEQQATTRRLEREREEEDLRRSPQEDRPRIRTNSAGTDSSLESKVPSPPKERESRDTYRRGNSGGLAAVQPAISRGGSRLSAESRLSQESTVKSALSKPSQESTSKDGDRLAEEEEEEVSQAAMELNSKSSNDGNSRRQLDREVGRRPPEVEMRRHGEDIHMPDQSPKSNKDEEDEESKWREAVSTRWKKPEWNPFDSFTLPGSEKDVNRRRTSDPALPSRKDDSKPSASPHLEPLTAGNLSRQMTQEDLDDRAMRPADDWNPRKKAEDLARSLSQKQKEKKRTKGEAKKKVEREAKDRAQESKRLKDDWPAEQWPTEGGQAWPTASNWESGNIGGPPPPPPPTDTMPFTVPSRSSGAPARTMSGGLPPGGGTARGPPPDRSMFESMPPGTTFSGGAAPATASTWPMAPPPLPPPASTRRQSRSKTARLHVRRPFAEVAHDLDGFTAQFIRAAAQATGVAPHRIRVKSVRCGD